LRTAKLRPAKISNCSNNQDYGRRDENLFVASAFAAFSLANRAEGWSIGRAREFVRGGN
jgi:hypothetical protein